MNQLCSSPCIPDSTIRPRHVSISRGKSDPLDGSVPGLADHVETALVAASQITDFVPSTKYSFPNISAEKITGTLEVRASVPPVAPVMADVVTFEIFPSETTASVIVRLPIVVPE